MATESPIRMLDTDESKKWLPTMDSALYSSPFSTLADHQAVNKVFKGNVVNEEQIHTVPNRSGSAPPTIEGSIAAFQAFMDQRNSTLPSSKNEFLDCESEEQMRTDPAYISYYYANVNLNPRLPPPLISRENRNLMQFMGGFDGKNISVSKGLLATHKEDPEEAESPSKASDDQKESSVQVTKVTSTAGHNGSSVDLMEGGLIQAPSPVSSTTFKGGNDHDIGMVSTTATTLKMQESCSVSVDTHSMSSSTNPSVLTASNCRNLDVEDTVSIQSNIGSDVSVVESRMKLLDVSDGSMRSHAHDQNRHVNTQLHNEDRFFPHPSPDMTYQLPGFQTYAFPRGVYAFHQKLLPMHQSFMPNSGLIPPLYASTAAHMSPGNLFYPTVPQPGFPPSPQHALGESSMHSVFHPHFARYLQDLDAFSKADFFKQRMEALPVDMNPYTAQVLRPPFGGPLQGQCFQPIYDDAQRSALQCHLDALVSRKDPPPPSSIAGKEINHRTIETLSLSSPTSAPHIRVTYGYPLNLGEPQFPAPSAALPGTSISRDIHQGLRNDPSASQQSPKSTAVFSGWKGERGPESSDNFKRHSILELLKSNNSKTLELSVFSGQIVEFSTDQHGSRFIQQKLENCGSEEKESVFKEVLPQASRLMTDVFGNYVVQKFFEHGTEEQRRKLGQQLSGQVLTLSLQMYGCRVIQKALEVIELDQKVELIAELDGHVIRCVHDQNGNHVIQKCIETVPTEKIKFIISSFAGQVATLSCHPYGCRVIQRVLEHCLDEQIRQWIVDEILESTYTLAHDPYGNYVTQHVMEMGKPHQRSQIIHKLTGQFVQLSQHKFASNVVEKCIKYGNDSERNLIIEEIIADSDNNEALLMMMKDQFANYVVQKIFEIGSEKQKDTLQNCVRLHLPALKKVTYAKHIVSRYEQLTGGVFLYLLLCLLKLYSFHLKRRNRAQYRRRNRVKRLMADSISSTTERAICITYANIFETAGFDYFPCREQNAWS
ncbi:Pumilio-like protein 5 [Bienertia sinuspersici]